MPSVTYKITIPELETNCKETVKFKTFDRLYKLMCLTICATIFWGVGSAFAQLDSTKQRKDSLRYPISDRLGDPYSHNRRGFNLSDTSFIKKQVEYDSKTKQYYVTEKIGNQYYRTPTSFSMEDFINLQGKKDEEDYFKKRANLLANMNRRLAKPKFKVNNDWFNRLMGVGPDGKVKVEIKPVGSVDILAGYQGQKINNPTLPERARNNGGFDFNMNARMQLDASIGNNLRLPINYNTLANLDFENQLKLNYQGQEDAILKQFQAGTVNFSTKSTLIPGAQSLFGIKTQLQFGKLFLTAVVANQRSTQQSAGLQGGAGLQQFSIKADEYDENRHFLLSQYFRNNFNTAMKQLPIVNSAVQILRTEVWVTNRNGSTTDLRDVVALMDLAETNPYAPLPPNGNSDPKPFNAANSLYASLQANPNARNSSLATGVLTGPGFNLVPVQDFEKTFARKLQASEYFFSPQIGFLSLQQPLREDEVLGVAYQYTYNGRIYQVGEFSQDVPPDSTGTSQKVLFLKLLKATSQRTNLPLWDLMMKNVYSVGDYGQLEEQDFALDVVYEEPSLGEKRYMPAADVDPAFQYQPLITQLSLDRLNNQRDPQPDGKFDYIPGFTVIPSQSRIIFPVLEPFGHDLDQIYSTQAMRNKYLFYPLYDTIKAIAKTFANLNRFELKGKSKTSGQSGGSGSYQLGYNIPRGSVTVTAGGQVLQENVDYEIDYNSGSLRVINQAVINSGVPVNIQYENQAAFALQQKNFMGLRLDYVASEKLTVGGTIVRLGERPFFIKQAYGEDPVKNTMYGFDIDYRSDVPRISKWLDKLPFYSTKTTSSITAYAEAAFLQPGHPKQINASKNDKGGLSYVDDFEGARSSIDLRFPLVNWALASIPQGQPSLFPDASASNDVASGYERAKLAWYNIEPVLQERRNQNNPMRGNLEELSRPETRQVLNQEIFPKRSLDFGQGLLTTFDLAFYPKDKGPYNFQTDPSKIDANNRFRNPQKSWGGLMRNIDQIDFETGNIEYIEFWMQDPFVKNEANPNGGSMYINLGNISEDVLKDGKRFYENGLPTPKIPSPVDNNTVWGKAPSNPLQITNAFSNDPNDREFQDVGFDGLIDADEQIKFADYLANLSSVVTGAALEQAKADPSGDNFKAYRDASFDNTPAGILDRYKHINNPSGNSPVSNNSQFVNAFTQYPDGEELNKDNTLNEVEEYFQYKVDIKQNMPTGSNFITDKRVEVVKLADGNTRLETWYLFRIPVSQYELKVGNIPDFKSIRFMRMFVTGFEDSVVMRFGKLELVRNTWRQYKYKIDTSGNYLTLPQNDPTDVNTLAVNLEENDTRQPINYVMPPGIERQQQLSNNNVQLYMNEQSLSVQLKNLPRGETRGVFVNRNLDMRQYQKIKMFMHAESMAGCGSSAINDGDLTAVIRMGSDFSSNYYEVRIPLKKTNFGERDTSKVWPQDNNLDFDLEVLTQMKSRRNKAGVSTSAYYSEEMNTGRRIGIFGNPNLGEVRGILLSVENTKQDNVCAEVWFNELRFSNLDESGGMAALGRVDLKLADLGSITVAGTMKTRGWGTIEQRVNERSREDVYSIDVSTNIDAGKLLPKKLGVTIPVYAGFSQIASTPEYDPYDLDIKLKDKIRIADPKNKDSIRSDAQDITSIRTLNFTNVKKIKTDGKKPKIWSVTNFDLSYSFIETKRHTPLVENDLIRRTTGIVAYSYQPEPKIIEPFKRLIKSKSKWLALIKDFNFNYVPSQLSFRANVFRQFGATRQRNVGGGPYKIPETYDKYFTFDRFYILQWSLTKSLSIDFNAANNARIDEPIGRIDNSEKKAIVKKNFFSGGRNTNYQQDITVSYKLPTQKIPVLAWTNITAKYNTRYNWLASSLLAKSLGNTLSNTQTKNINAELNFEQLYDNFRLLRTINTPKSGSEKNKTENTNTKQQPINVVKSLLVDSVLAKMLPKERRKAIRADKKRMRIERRKIRELARSQPMDVGGITRLAGGLLTAVKRVSIEYTEDFGTTLPGYMDSTNALGTNLKSGQPGLGFILGYQPDTSWINRAGAKGIFSRSDLVSALIQQRYNQTLKVTAQVSPFRDFTIDLNLNKTFDKNYSELYKDTTGTAGLARLNPYALGSFSISYISYKTLFTKNNPNVVSETFKQFEDYRAVLSKRLGQSNPYNGANPTPNTDGYYEGYGRYAQEVIIPAFLAAYTGKSPNTINLTKNSNPNIKANPFSSAIPKPNWSVTYNGLTRIPGVDKIFSNFSLRHGYHSTLSMNSFNTALLFSDPLRMGYPSFKDSTGYIPFFLVPNITIAESFDPLFSVDMTFTNQLGVAFEFSKSRQLSLSLIDYQLSETRSTGVTFDFNWRKKGMPLIKKIGKWKLDNDVTFKLSFSLRDDATSNSKLDQGVSLGTAGQKAIRISPSIDYVLNKRIGMQLYFEQTKNIPKISNSFPITNTRGGLRITVSLSQ